MKKRIGLSIVAVTVAMASAFFGAACSPKTDEGGGEKSTYTVTFDANEGAFADGSLTSAKSVESGGYATCDAEPIRDDFFFYGWLVEADDTEAVDLSVTAITKDITFYAGWRDGVSITYYYNYVGAPSSVYKTDKVARGSLLTAPAKPARDGYTFDYWTIDADGHNKWAFSTDKASVDVPLYAQWTKDVAPPTLHTVTLHIGSETETYSVADNSAFVEPNDPEIDGYDFIEWRVGSLSGNKYDFNSVVTADLDLYAYIEVALPKNVHRINYILDDGTSTAAKNSSANPTVFTEGNVVTLAQPSRDCYTFDGWYKDFGFATKVTTVGGSETDNVTLYAKWKYSYPFFVTGDHVEWMKYSDFATIQGINAQKEECAMYPLITGTGEERTWDGKSYVAERVHLLASGSIATTGVKIIGYSEDAAKNNTVWFGAQGKTSNDSNIAVSEEGYYTVTIKVKDANSLEVPTLKLRKFAVSFVLENSDLTVDDKTVKDGGYIAKPVFQGGDAVWYTDPQKTKAWNFASYQVTSDMTLYGVYAVKTYNVVYASLNHLTWNTPVSIAEYGDTLDLGYTLEEGYSDSPISVTVNNEIANGTTFVADLDDVDIIVVNIFGNIFINTYTVSFMLKGDEIHSEVVSYGNSVVAPDIEFMIENDWDINPEEEYIGYWVDLYDKSIKFYPDDNSVVTIENVTESMTLECQTEMIVFTVDFDSRGGTPVASQTKYANSTVDKPADPTRDNYIFIGWYKDKDCTDGNKWRFGADDGGIDMVKQDTTLYAKWELQPGADKHTVTFLYQKNGEQFKQVDVSASDDKISDPPEPSRSGYTFDKWYDVATDSEFDFANAIGGDKTLYAVWKLAAPSVTLADISGAYKAESYTLTAEVLPVAGLTYSYKWYKDGVVIGGATGTTYSVTNVADSGNYSVEVTVSDGVLAPQFTQANATVDIAKAVLPEISGIGFKNDDAFTKKIVFTADSTSFATQYAVTVFDGVFDTDDIAETMVVDINDREFAYTVGLYEYCRVKITYGGFVYDSSNIENTAEATILWFVGIGTAEHPFVVGNANALMHVADHPTAYFKQSMEDGQSYIIDAKDVSSLFTADAPFTGVYDGKGGTIQNFGGKSGLFGYIGEGAVVKNLNMTAVSISGSSSVAFVGGVASVNSGTVDNVVVGASGDGSTIGSLAGTVTGDITSATVDYATGGIVGKNGGTVSNCINYARLYANKCVAGIVGYNMPSATVTGCTNNGLIGTTKTDVDVNGFMNYAGGLVGQNVGTLTQSINNGEVTAYKSPNSTKNNNSYYGGLAARNDASGTISECINNGTVRTDFAAAGLVSRNYGKVEYCVNTGSVNARETSSNGMATGNGQVLYCVMTGTVNLTNGADPNSVKGNTNCSGTGTSTVKYCYYKSSSDAPTSSSASNNAVYNASSHDAMLTVLGNKFVWDGEKVTLAFAVD